MGEKTLRLFVALAIAKPVLDAIAELQADLRRQLPDRAVRWTRPQGIHLTLQFLGDTPAGQQPDLEAALRAAAAKHAPLTLGAGGIGCFPNTKRPRVVWVGLAGGVEPLRALQGDVAAALADLGFEPDRRRFNPHLTLGRLRRGASAADVRAVGEWVAAAEVGALGAWAASTLDLMRSELRPDGARYTALARLPLGG